MDPATLERLLMDSSLNSLDPDTQSLLTAYLRRDAAAARHAQRLTNVANLASRVLTATVPATLPPFPRDRLHRAERIHRIVIWTRTAAALAACILLGIGIALFATARSITKAPPAHSTAPIYAEAPQPTLQQPPHPTATGFWSAARLYDHAAHARPHDVRTIIWHSPVQQPRLGGST